MDRYVVEVAAIDCKMMVERLRKAKPVERITLDIKSVDKADITSFNKADLILAPGKLSAADMDIIFKNKASYAQVIIVIDKVDEAVLEDDEFIEKFYDVWTLENPILDYRIHATMKKLRLTMDYELSGKHLTTLIDSVPDLIWFKDTRGSHMSVNQSFCETINKTKEQIKDRGHCYIWDLDPAEYEQGEYVCMETEDVVIEEQGTFLFDEKVKIRDEMRQLKTYKSAIVGRRGETIGTVGIARDVTDIWNSHEEFKTLLNRLPYAIMIVTQDYGFVSINEKFEELFGEKPIENHEFGLFEFSMTYFKEDITRMEEENSSFKVAMMVEGEQRYYGIDKVAIHDMFDKLSGFFYIIKDETEAYRYEEKLKAMSETDELTQLYNRKAMRNYFDMNTELLFQENHSMAICMLDLDYFKQYNDYYGHVSGDKVLKQFGVILHEIRDRYGVFVARYGGEEFMMIANSMSEDEVKEVADMCMSKLTAYQIPHDKSSISDVVTVSIGIAYYDSPVDRKISEVIAESDMALYEAKTNGRNRYEIRSIK